MIYISKVLKPWVYNSKEDMKDAYNECWRQKDELSEEVQELEKVIFEIKDIISNSDPDDKAFYYLSAIDTIIAVHEGN